MKLAIVTLFNGLSNSYSLVNVVAEQLQMLLHHNHTVKLLVSEQCSLENLEGVYADPRIQWCRVSNSLHGAPIRWHDYSQPSEGLHESFYEELDVIVDSLSSFLGNVDVCILHDILFQGWHYIHNIAIRKVSIAYPSLRFVAFTHSFPHPRPAEIPPHLFGLYSPLKNTSYVYPTYSGIPALAQQYQVPEGRCKVVHHSFSSISFYCEEVQQLHREVNLYDCDLLMIYPARLTPSKQLELILPLAGAFYHHCEQSVKIIYCDFPSSDIDSQSYKSQIMAQAKAHQLPPETVVFTSDHGFPLGFPRNAVLDLFSLSNLFVLPSLSESFGLTVLEAASRGNFLVLNHTVPALSEIGDQLHAYYIDWPGLTLNGIVTPTCAHPEEFYQKHAKKIVDLMIQNPVLHAKTMIRTHYQPEWIWHNQLEPILRGFSMQEG